VIKGKTKLLKIVISNWKTLIAMYGNHSKLGMIEGFMFFFIQITLIEGFVLFLYEKSIEIKQLSCKKHVENIATHVLYGSKIHVVS
jgi:hypothetical protein